MKYANTSFYAPLYLLDFEEYTGKLRRDERFSEIEKNEKNEPAYLFPYATRIFSCKGRKENDCSELYCGFELKKEHLPDMLDESDESFARLEKITLHCFSTGCAFVEFFVSYNSFDIEQITDFVATFKRAARKTEKEEQLNILDVLEKIFLQEEKTQNLTVTNKEHSYKSECRFFTRVCIDEPENKEDLEKNLRHLARGYFSKMALPEDFGDYDMIYSPYGYDHWAGSQEGIVNLCFYTEDEKANNFIRKHKLAQLISNYGFLYLLLLNQRISAIKLIEEIANYSNYKRKEREELNKRIVFLKTVFAFNIISDDMLYQNLYKRMYILMDIDRLLADIHENEQQVEMMQNSESLEIEKLTSSFLFGISVLSIFSVLIDAASYFDRFSTIRSISTWLSLACMIAIVSTYIAWWIKHRSK